MPNYKKTDPQEPEIKEISVEEATTEQKLTALVKFLDEVLDQQEEQTHKLRSIIALLTVVIGLFIIQMVFQEVLALGLIK